MKENGTVIAVYGYDDNSNRTSINGTVVAFYDDQDRLHRYKDFYYYYTVNGELENKIDPVMDETTTYNYDVLGNLMSVTLPDTTLIEYIIDGRNRRVGKKVNEVFTQRFLYQDQLNPLAEVDESGNVISALSMLTKEISLRT